MTRVQVRTHPLAINGAALNALGAQSIVFVQRGLSQKSDFNEPTRGTSVGTCGWPFPVFHCPRIWSVEGEQRNNGSVNDL